MKKIFQIILGLSLAVNAVLLYSLLNENDSVLIFSKAKNTTKQTPRFADAELKASKDENVFIPEYIAELKTQKPEEEYQIPGSDFDYKVWKRKQRSKRSKSSVKKVLPKVGMSASQVALYPYSTADELNLEVKNPPTGKIGVYVISGIGNVEAFYEFKSERQKKRKMSLDVSRLAKGSYFLHCVSGDSRVVKRFKKV